MRSVFVNLPVSDLPATRAFWTALGFDFDPQYSDDSAACLVIEQNVFAMLLTHDRFRDFVNGDIADAHATTEVLVCLSCDSAQEVDELVERAIAAGGKPWKPAQDSGPMHGASFQDPDGHVWELVSMSGR